MFVYFELRPSISDGRIFYPSIGLRFGQRIPFELGSKSLVNYIKIPGICEKIGPTGPVP